MRMKIKKWLAAFTVAAGMVLPATTAFAFTDEAAQQAVEAPAPTETPVQEEEPPKTEETPFSVPGNGSLADDKSGDSTKEFLTVQTKNGNTFFLVLDRSSNKENVYMLSMIDEDDLAEFVTETKKQETEQPTVITQQPETKPAVEETEKEPEKESKETIEIPSDLKKYTIIGKAEPLDVGVYYTDFGVFKDGKKLSEHLSLELLNLRFVKMTSQIKNF